MSGNQGVLVIGSDAVLTGEVKGARQVEVFGTVNGGVDAGDLTIREGGRFKGTVRSNTSTVEGTLEGDVRVQQLISIKSSGAVSGHVKYGRLAMEEGASLAASVRNIPPSIAGDLDLTVSKGRSVRITTADLTAIDPDDTADALTFRVSNVSGGMITQTGAPGLAVETFTQADLEAGRVLFVHDGGPADTASFNVVVTDDDGASSGPAQTVKVAVRA
jgi:cytoskeletal protein CcmA (bactofilin family)